MFLQIYVIIILGDIVENIFFKLKGINYIVAYKDNKIIFYKNINNIIVPLSNEEKMMLEHVLSNNYNYIYNSDFLNSLIAQNNSIENREYIRNFLTWLEQCIPEQSRENFYRNIKTLRTTLNIDIDLSKYSSDILKGYSYCGGYNTRDNTIVISPESLNTLKMISQKTEQPDEFYWRAYSQTLLHEFAHMASSKFDSTTETSLCGFDTFPSKTEEDRNRGLTEGFTEIISMAGVPNTIEIASGYYIEALLINQLIQTIGNEVFVESYFSNLGTSPMQKKLEQLINDKSKSYELFRNIELNYQIGDFDEEQNVLGNIQLTILDYFEKKLEILLQCGNLDDIKSTLQIYEQMLVTPDKIVIMNKNPNNYIRLNESLTRFESIKQKYNDVLINRDDSYHR